MIVSEAARETPGAPDMTLIFLLNMSASWMSPSSMTSGLTTTREVSGVTNWYLANKKWVLRVLANQRTVLSNQRAVFIYLSERRRARSRLLQMIGSAGAPSSSWTEKHDHRCRLLTYRVVINERHKVHLYCDFILNPGDFLGLLGAHQMWSIW